MQGGCNVEIHMSGFGINTFHEGFFNLFNVVEIFVEENQVKRAFEFSELNKSVLLSEALKTNKAYRFGDLPDSFAFEL